MDYKEAPAVGRYHYDTLDRGFLHDRVEQFREQVARRLSGELSEDEFKPLRLMNGLYLQLHAYMLRVAIPYGVLGSAQLRVLAGVARRYDRGYGHITTRQNMQFNWIRLQDAPDILQELATAELHTLQTSGNCIRNVTCDQFAGAAADEILDPRVYAEILRQWSTLHPEFSFLPRKFKIAISGTPHDRVAARFHDIGLLTRKNTSGEPVFEVFAGGGMGRAPSVGILMRAELPEADLLAYLEAVIRVYNAWGRRDNIFKARIKVLVQSLGAGAFRQKVEDEFRAMDRSLYRLEADVIEAIRARFGSPELGAPPDAHEVLAAERARDREFDRWVMTNTHPHRVPGRICVAVSVKPEGGIPGDLTADQMESVATLAERFSFGELRFTHMQNIVLPHVRQDQLHALWQELRAAGLGMPNIGLVGDIICCPGLDYCALANARSIPIAQKISARFADPQLQQQIGPVRINISGCINACGHHHVGHIGLLGVDKKGAEYFQITLGGSAGVDAAVGEIIGPALPEDDTVEAISRLLEAYLARREGQEQFLDTYRRLGPGLFREAVYASA